MKRTIVLPWRAATTGTEPTPLPTRKFRLGAFQVDPSGLVIRNGIRSSSVERKAMEVLLCLADHATETVSREQIFERAWRGAHVSTGVLNRVIYLLRKALDDDPRAPHYIQTVPRVGYRLLLPVDWHPEASLSPENKAPVRWLWPAIAGSLALALLAIGYLATRTNVRPSLMENVDIKVRPLTFDSGWELQPALAQNGERLAYLAFDDSGEGGIFVDSLASTSEPKLFVPRADDWYPELPTWSPNGLEIAWYEHNDSGGCRIRTQSLVAVSPERKFPCTTVGSLDWAPQGRHLLVSTGGTANLGDDMPIVELDLDTGEMSSLFRAPAGYSDIRARYSPDGSQVAAVRIKRGTGSSVLFFDRTTSSEQTVELEGFVQFLDWLNQDELIFDIQQATGLGNLWRYRVSTHVMTRIPETQGATAPAVGAESRVAFVRRQEEYRIWKLGLDGSSPELLEDSTQMDIYPGTSPDNSSIAFVSLRSGELQVWHRVPNHRPVQISSGAAEWIGPVRWQQDGQAFLFERRDGGDEFSVEKYNVNSRQLEHIEVPFERYRAPVWGPTGTIIISVFGNGVWNLWQESKGEWQQVTFDGGFVAETSSDGRLLYYTKFDQPGIWRREWGGLKEEQIVDWLGYGDRLNWAVIGDAVVAKRNDAAKTCSLVLISEDGESELIELGSADVYGIASSDAQIVYSTREIQGADLYELNLSAEQPLN